MSPKTIFLSTLALAALVPNAASASERHFAFTYETGVLEPGAVELEPWTTVRLGRERYYSRIDNRLEFELGLTEQLQTAVYWNFTRLSRDVEDAGTGLTTRQQSFELTSVSSEWKYKLSDPVADALGSALYLEGSYGPAKAELEAKLLFDKQLDRVLLAANVVGEYEWEFAVPGETETEIELALPLAATYFIGPTLTLGLELNPVAGVKDGELESVAFYAGPSFSAAYDSWWLSLAALPQVYSPKNAAGESLDLKDNEHVRVRLLLGFHL